MKLSTRIRVLAIVLIGVGGVVFTFGPQYEISKIPPAIRSQMSDTDWIGVEWIALGMILAVVALGCFILAWLLDWRARKSQSREVRR